MIEINEEQKILFLKAFTEELIRSSFKRVGLFQIEMLIGDKYGIQKPEERRELVKKIVEYKEKEREEMVSSIHELSRPVGYSPSFVIPKKPVFKRPLFGPSKTFNSSKIFNPQKILNGPRVLKVPGLKLPSRLNYLKPVKTNEEIDVGKLNPLVQDPNVVTIEIEGPNKNVFVSGKMGTKKTGIILNQAEIDKIIRDFSINARIPVSEGVNKMAFGKLLLNAIISDKANKRLGLKKIAENPGFVPKRRVFST